LLSSSAWCLSIAYWEEKAPHLDYVTIYFDGRLDKQIGALQAKNPDLNVRTCSAVTIPRPGQIFGRCIGITH
jgi:hypothetical protein